MNETTTDESAKTEAFAPLTDWGTPGAGCTEIQYKQDGAWVTI